jgi:hypothetical protein
MIVLLGRSYFHLVPRRPHSMLFLCWTFPWRNLLWFWWVNFVCYSLFLSYSLQYSFSSLCAYWLIIIYCGVGLFCSSLLHVLEASCTLMGIVFSRFVKFSVIICSIYYSFLLLAPLILHRCPWFSGLVF